MDKYQLYGLILMVFYATMFLILVALHPFESLFGIAVLIKLS